ncbi:protein TASOR-like [Festucalex cinctus]
MESGVARRVPYPPSRRVSSDYHGGASASVQDGESARALVPTRGETLPSHPGGRGGPGTPSPARGSFVAVHQRHMPKETDKFQRIPKKEKKALLKNISSESREYEGVMSILTAGHVDANSAGCFTYSCPRLVHSEQLEKEFVEKRREMKAEGRTDKELEESYCFLLTEEPKVARLCEKGLFVGQNWQSALGDPKKGVYLCRYSDLIQVSPFHHGASGEIIVFKVMKGKVKSVHENIKSVLDPTPRFDSHLSKNVSKVTSVSCYRAFEHTQHYFYEYDFVEVKRRPRQVCPYAVVSFQYKGKDAPLPSMPLAPVRTNSWSRETSKELPQFTVWSGDLVHDDKILFPISLRSSLLPFLPHQLPDRLNLGRWMRLDTVTKLLPHELFSYNLYGTSKEVVTQGHHCSLLEAVDRSRSANGIGRLLQELEEERVVLVNALTERGFLFLLSSAQMATPPERRKNWKRCLQALFVFPESRVVDKSASNCASSCDSFGAAAIMAGLEHFVPALHHALVRSHANPASELATGVELHAQEYLAGMKEGKVRAHAMAEYDVKADEAAAPCPAYKHLRLNADAFLRPYLHGPARYQLALEHASKMVELHCAHLRPPLDTTGKGQQGAGRNTHKLQQLLDLVMTCKRNAENEVTREEARGGDSKTRRQRMEQKAARRALEYLKASHEPSEWNKSAAEGRHAAAPPDPLALAVHSAGLVGVAVHDDGSELAGRLHKLLKGLRQAARAPARSHSSAAPEDGQAESSPFDRLAAKMGLPANRDIDLRKQDELEEQTAGSVSSLEGFSPNGESYHQDPRAGAGGGVAGRSASEDEIPWRLIPITGLRSNKDVRRDPRLQFGTASPLRQPPWSPSHVSSPGTTPSPSPSPPASPARCPSPEPRRQAPPEGRRLPSPAASPPPRFSPRQHQPSPPEEQKSHADPQQRLAPPAPGECAASTISCRPQSPLRSPPPHPIAPNVSSEISSNPFDDDDGGGGVTVERGAEGREDGGTSAPAASSALRPGGETEAEDVVDLTVSSEEDDGGVSLVSPPPSPLRSIDDILGNHLGGFSADLRLLLQQESIDCQLPDALAVGPADPRPSPMPPFSQYVSLYHPCLPVQSYVSSLHDGIAGMLREYERAPPGPEPESALASTVSAFVSGIRAGTDEDGAERAEEEAAGENRASPVGRLSDPPPHAANRQPSPARSDGVSASSPPASGGSDPAALPPADALNDVIRQLNPEVLSNLCDIIKDVQRSAAVQFYVHALQADDRLLGDVKEYLTQQGHTEQDPVSFLKQEASDRKLLVIIKNDDVAEHIHEIPGLVSLKQHQSVVFVGVDKADDVRTQTYQRLFVRGGCVLSDDLVLNPDLVTSVQLEALLALLEQRNSSESVWMWKIHSKPLKKLKEQARFRRDAASLLDVVLKRLQQKMLEVLPQHHCDDADRPSPDLSCLIRHQAQHARFRHTVFLRVHSLDFLRFSKSGIIAASVDEMLNGFDALLGHRGDADDDGQTIAEDPHADEDGAGKPDGAGDANGDDVVVVEEEQARRPDASLPAAAAEQRPVSETSAKESADRHSVKDLHMLQMAISQLRADMHHKRDSTSDAESRAEPATATPPPANPNAAADSTGDSREEAELNSSKKADDSGSSTSTSCPAKGDTTSRTASGPERSLKRGVTTQPRQIPSHASSTFSQRWRGPNNNNHHNYHQNHPYQNHPYQNHPYQNYPYQNYQHRQQQRFWDFQRGRGGFNGM